MRKGRTLPCPQARRLGPGQEMGGHKTMLRKTLIACTLCALLLVVVAASLCRSALGSVPAAARRHRAVATDGPTGTLQKLIVENGTVTLNLDLNQLNGISSTQNIQQMHFAVGANSFFPILIFNDSFRAIEPGSMALIPQGTAAFPAVLNASPSRL